MKYKDYYAALGVPRDADLEQIKKAYRKLARQHHPDMSKAPEAEAQFKEAAEAYATLKDPEKRAVYDEMGRHPAGEEFAPPPQWQYESSNQGNGMDDLDLADFLAALGRGQGRASRTRAAMPGRDFETSVRISLEDAHRGTTLNLDLRDGGGERTLQVTIPAGVTDRQKLRLRGKGGKGLGGGPDGDIYLHIALAPHAIFRADHHDLYFDLALAPWEAALGAEIEVATLDQPVLLTVPPLTRSGRKLRLRGRGLSNGKDGRGDLYAVVHIDMPSTLSSRERELYQELARTSTFSPRAAMPKEQTHEPTKP
jgi:curved DNA-binding protein